MKKSVYIETTIPSFYFEIRKQPEMVARRNWTREWWDHHSQKYELFTSAAVLEELIAGQYPGKIQVLELMRDINVLDVNEEIFEIVDAYIAYKAMPKDPKGDALHLAVASFYKCDFLLTWNCQHLANANKMRHVQGVNVMLGLWMPALITPMELTGGVK
ncbi:MAG: hypothetical protein COW13_00805 [Candidatus Omnitrophica bacterium CG12_big_fil_rev_8_21_14_0_65_50_5]|nr:MAG: hypothetical protein COW13_00805 [Candidatus Omnitrophica bacterium CG12_big_fil_rev_8_21_14_0_65_50_5]